jgi:Tfp pilus assembly protein FimT
MATRTLEFHAPLQRPALEDQAGFSIGEVTLAVAIIGVLAVLSTPMFVGYYQAARLRVAAEQVASSLNQGRQLGIRENVGVCVEIASTAVRYRTVNCSGAVWVGAGSDAAGYVALSGGVTVTRTADPRFNYLGAATPPGATYTVTVTNTRTSATLRVFVAASGRVTVGP